MHAPYVNCNVSCKGEGGRSNVLYQLELPDWQDHRIRPLIASRYDASQCIPVQDLTDDMKRDYRKVFRSSYDYLYKSRTYELRSAG